MVQLNNEESLHSEEINLELRKKPESLTKIAISKFMDNKLAVVGAIIIFIIISTAIAAPWIVSFEPEDMNLVNQLAPPGGEHLFGTDDLGRDTLSRLLYGSRVSLTVSFVAVIGIILIGTVIGAIAGYFGGIVDSILMRFVDIVISFPQIFLLITLIVVLEPNLGTLIIVFALFSWTGTARLVRGEFLTLRTREFVLAAKTMGIRTWKIIFSHILPNAIGPIIVSATLQIGYVILAESTLSYLGLGVQPPTPSWGNMLQNAQDYNIMLNAWWYPLFPGLMILITILSFNFVGDGLRDAFDPKLNK